MHQENLPDGVFDIQCILRQQVLAGMAGEPADGCDLRPDRIWLTKDPDLFFPIRQPSAERVRGLPGDDTYRILWVLDIVFQMMEDSSRLCHAGGRDDDHWIVPLIECLRLLNGLNIGEQLEIEGGMLRLLYKPA